MKGINNYPVVDTSDPTNYPNGCIKDRGIGLPGTPINKITNNDIQLFFDKMARNAGLTINGLLDSEGNGYQTLQALGWHINQYVGQFIQWYFGDVYSNSAVYIFSGALWTGGGYSDGIGFYNGKVCFIKGYTGSACGGGDVPRLVLDTLPAYITTFNIQCGTSGTGYVDLSNAIRPVNYGAITAVTYNTALNYQASPTPIRVWREYNRVFVDGQMGNSFGASVISVDQLCMTLPANHRPPRTIYRNFIGDMAGTALPSSVAKIETNGNVTLLGTLSPFTNNFAYLAFDFDVNR